MAKERMINTRFWSDNWISGLDPVEKLLYLYLLTNSHCTLCGIYELPLKVMAIETGIENTMVQKILNRFVGAKKIKYQDSWVAIKKFLHYHLTGSPKLAIGATNDLRNCPKWAVDFIWDDTLSIPYPYPIDTISPSASASASASALASASTLASASASTSTLAFINNAPPNGDIIEKELEETEKGGINYPYQYLGLEIFEKLGSPRNKKGECIRLCKMYPKLINPALSFSADYPDPVLRWKMFLWKLNNLRQNENKEN